MTVSPVTRLSSFLVFLGRSEEILGKCLQIGYDRLFHNPDHPLISFGTYNLRDYNSDIT
jgi:hypothetical protein